MLQGCESREDGLGKLGIGTRSLEHGRAASHAGHQKSSFKETNPPLNTRTEDCFHGVGRPGIHKQRPAGSKAGTREEEPLGSRGEGAELKPWRGQKWGTGQVREARQGDIPEERAARQEEQATGPGKAAG